MRRRALALLPASSPARRRRFDGPPGMIGPQMRLAERGKPANGSK
jgi:hypothetical protein